nr:unnamed protein product [Digitaria exilis]
MRGGAVAVKAGSRPPWLGLGAAAWVQVAGGASSTFALYSHALKVALGADQRRLALLGVACDVGDNLGLFPGVLCNRLHPALLLLVGGAACLLGYGAVWLLVSGAAPALPYWLIWFALCLAANGGAWMGTAVLVTNMRNFPVSRGSVAGILKGYSGLSAAVFTEIYTGVLRDSPTNLLLFLTLGVPAVLLDHVLTLNDIVNYSLLIIMAVLIFAPLAIPLKMTLFPRRKSPSNSSDCLPKADNGHTEALLPSSSESNLGNFEDDDSMDIDILYAEGEGAIKPERRRPRRGEDFRSRTLPRSVLIVCTQVALIVAYLLLAWGHHATLYVSVALLGISYGVQFTVMISTSSELFGLKHFGKIYNFIALANPVGAFLFNTLLGYVYDLEVQKQKAGMTDTDIACHGPNCFRLTFFVFSGAACLGTLLSTVLTVRVRPVYQMLYGGGSFSQPRSSAH